MILVRYSEIALKGKNRPYFENKLVENIRNALKKNKIKFTAIKRPRGRILIYTNNKCNLLKYIFGIASYSNATEVDFDLDNVKNITSNLLKKFKNKKFRVTAKRLDNSINKTSMDINTEIGDYIIKNTNAKVDLTNFDIELGIEILNKKAYIFTKRIQGKKGMPISTAGKVIALIEKKQDLLAALLAMKRGCSIIPLSTKKANISLLNKYGNNNSLIKIKNINEINKIAEKKKIKTLISGQTLDDYKEIKTELMVLRPLIAFDNRKINKVIHNYI